MLSSLPRFGDSFFLEDEEIIITGGNYANKLLLQPNANEMKNTQFHSQEKKALKVTKKYKTLEILAVEARLGDNEVIFLGIYRPPK